MITVGIVDDEFHARESIRTILENYCPTTKLVGMAGTLAEARQLLEEHQPQLLFLDIGLPDGSGFELMNYISPLKTKVAFVSAQLDRGAETYELRALYYMTKPIRIVDIGRAVELCQETIALEELVARVNFDRPGRWDDVLIASETDWFRFVNLEEIVYLRANRNCCEAHLVNFTHVVITKPIKEIEGMLPHPDFLRTHRSYIVNRRYVSKVAKNKRGDIEMENGQAIPMSEEYIDDIRTHLLRQSEEARKVKW